jgi:uncharacterized protein YqhQ
MAITDGVFLRGAERWAAACRRPGGDIAVVTGDLPTWYRRWAQVPLARGIVALAESLSIGVRALLWSASITRGAVATPHPARVPRRYLVANLVPALIGSIALFFVGPAALAHWLVPARFPVASAVVETAARVALVLVYLASVRRIGEARRLFQNHGAEHKVVALHEAGLEPGIGVARWQPIAHARCGTTFFVIVVIVSAFAHAGLAAFGSVPLGLLLSGRAVLVPVAAAVAYELLLLTERAPRTLARRTLLRPGLALQSLTVIEPDDEQLEVALVALSAATAPSVAAAGAGGALVTSAAPVPA